MMRALPLILLMSFAVPAAAQDDGISLTPLEEPIGELMTTPNDVVEEYLSTNTEERVTAVEPAQTGALRVLDKLTGAVTDLKLDPGQTGNLGFLSVTLRECRYPVDNPSGDAFAYIQVVDRKESTPLFAGWVIASAPALNAMEHPRYDVWALRCITS